MSEKLNTPNQPKLPDLTHISGWVDKRIAFDSYVRKSFEEGYMNREELIVADYVKLFCDLNEPEDFNSSDWEKNLGKAYQVAAKQFNITPEKAEELYKKSLTIRSRIIDRQK